MSNNNNNNARDVRGVRNFWRGKTVFMTGATGFVGRFLVFKLLKDCDIKKVYICLREKPNLPLEKRLQEFKSLELFTYLPNPKVLDKIVALNGDITKPWCGFSDEDLNRIYDEVNVVYHSAATVRFNEPLKTAAILHIGGTENVLKICKKIQNLEILMHVSSIGAWCNQEKLREEIMEPSIDPKEFMKRITSLSKEDAAKIESEFIGKFKDGKFLNSYTFTKTLAEVVVGREKDDLPKVAVVRPPFLMSPVKDPELGWFDQPQAGPGLAPLFSLGLFRAAKLVMDRSIECIPVDYCVNALLTVPWYMCRVSQEKLEVFNQCSSIENPLCGREMLQMGIDLGYKYPSLKQIRPPCNMYHYLPSRTFIEMKHFFSHILFAYMIDFLLLITFQKPMLVRLTTKVVSAVRIIFESMVAYRSEYQIQYKNINKIYGPKCDGNGLISPEEKEIFEYDIPGIPWAAMGLQNHLRFRRVILKEPDSTLEYARKRLKIISIGYKFFRLGFWAFMLILMYGIYWILSFTPYLSIPWAAMCLSVVTIFVIDYSF